MNNKLKINAPIYWLTVENAQDRHVHMVGQFFLYGIDSHTLVRGYSSDNIWALTPNTQYPHIIDNRSLAIILSHLNIIKKFYYETTSEMALIFEDDISFELSNYWNFSLNEVIRQLPRGWNVIQLCLIRNENLTDVRFRFMRDSDWSVAAYLISRSYAKRLIDQYVRGTNLYHIDTVTSYYNLTPCIEAVLFCLDFANHYTFPILTENLDIPSTFYSNGLIENTHKSLNYKSGMEIVNWWRTNGSTKDLSYFFQQFK